MPATKTIKDRIFHTARGVFNRTEFTVYGTKVNKAATAYGVFATLDQWLSTSAFPEFFTAAQIASYIDLLSTRKDAYGNFAAFIGTDGTLYYQAGDLGEGSIPAKRAVGDVTWVMPQWHRDLYNRTGDLTRFNANKAAMKALMLSVPRDATTKLVKIGAVGTNGFWRPFGFQDGLDLTGLSLAGSTCYYMAAKDLQALYAAVGDTVNAAFFGSEAADIAANIDALKDGVTGMYFACSAYPNLDITFSSHAVHTGLVTGARATAISNYLATNYNTCIDKHGFIFQSPTGWGAAIRPDAPHGGVGKYDDSAWWFGGNWVATALNVANPALVKTLLATYAPCEDSTQEWFARTLPPGGERFGNTDNICSASQAYGAAKLLTDDGVTNPYSLIDLFTGAADSTIDAHTPNQGLIWGSANKAGASDLRLTGDGFVRNNFSPGSLYNNPTILPSAAMEIRGTIRFKTALAAGEQSTICLFTDDQDGNPGTRFGYTDSGWVATVSGTPVFENVAFPSIDTKTEFRILPYAVGSTRELLIQTSTNGGITWDTRFGGPLVDASPSGPLRVGMWFDGAPKTNTTGVHLGNLRVGTAPIFPVLTLSQSSGNTAQSVNLTLTGLGTNWLAGTPGTPTFVLEGGTGASLTGQTITSPVSATITLNTGSTEGVLRLIDPAGNEAPYTVTSAGPGPEPTPDPLVAGTLSGPTSTTKSRLNGFSYTAATGGTTPIEYQGQRKKTADALWSNVSESFASPFDVKNLLSSTEYQTRVRATDALDNIVYTNTQTATTAAAPAPTPGDSTMSAPSRISHVEPVVFNQNTKSPSCAMGLRSQSSGTAVIVTRNGIEQAVAMTAGVDYYQDVKRVLSEGTDIAEEDLGIIMSTGLI